MKNKLRVLLTLLILYIPNVYAKPLTSSWFLNVLFFIALSAILLVVAYFINKRKNITYKDLTFKNKYLLIESIIYLVVFLAVDICEFVLALNLLIVLYSCQDYNNKKILDNITDDRLIVKKITVFFLKYLFLIFIVDLIFSFFAGFKAIGIFFIYFLVITLIVAFKIVKKTSEEDTYKVKTKEEISKLLGNYDINRLYKMCFDEYITIEANLTTYTIDNVKTYLDDNMYNSYKEEQTSLLNKNEKHVLINTTFVSGGLIDYKVVGNIQEFQLEIVFNTIEYTVNLETGTITSGSTTRVKKYTYVFTFNYENNILKLVNKKKYKEE